MNETVNQEMNETAPAQKENRTFTQDEVNAIVADRLARERAKYADYDDLKAQAGKTDALQQQLDAIAADKARREMKQKVSDATGVPALHRPRPSAPIQTPIPTLRTAARRARSAISAPTIRGFRMLSAVTESTSRKNRLNTGNTTRCIYVR